MAWAYTCPNFRRRIRRLSSRCTSTLYMSYRLLISEVIANYRLSNHLCFDPVCDKALVHDFLLSSFQNTRRLHEMGVWIDSYDCILVDSQHTTNLLHMSTIRKELGPDHTRPMWKRDNGIRHDSGLQYSNRCCDAAATYALYWILADAKKEKVRLDSDVWNRSVVSPVFVIFCLASCDRSVYPYLS